MALRCMWGVLPCRRGGDGVQGECGGRNQQWIIDGAGRVINVNSNKCLDVYDFAGPAVSMRHAAVFAASL